ncbi:ATP-binding protein [Aquibium sp. A9E412]|uniref:sensor histidine kinase n=1 Tax=Aquibium sp. A9E412 TaxID=2976767 RepID=UPI0025AF75FB|nr:ATP-binding protein [Aquibium sp. A9E412]MDN2568124.1 ATP-binding protein [Aquibium sp. A9E412]
MTGGSLRLRLLLAAAAAVVVALAVAGAGLVYLFERHLERRVGAELDTHLDQLAAGIAFGPDGAAVLQGALADPRFERVYGGLYWQVHDAARGATLRSRSLWDTRLALPDDRPPVGRVHVHDVAGPAESRLRVHERRLVFAAPDGERVLRLAVAVDRADIAALRAAFASDVALALLLLGAALLVAFGAQVEVGLRPLAAVRRGLARVRAGAAARLDVAGPREIAPLVDEVNALLAAQEDAMARARARAADLAHGFRTPLTALLADARRLRARGETAVADDIEQTASRMRGHIERELARARLSDPRGAPATPVAPLAEGLAATLRRTPAGERVAIMLDVAPQLAVRIERDDLGEVLGNLMENAVRHAAGRVRLAARRDGARIVFAVEDDGPGIAEGDRRAVLARGGRLDRSGSGAGLGLAIVGDVLAHYGGALTLDRSALGGLAARFALPAAGA